jgi:trans-aconitate 2-methyltransferase
MGPAAADVWNPDLYGKFRSERARPFADLLALLVPVPGPSVVDLGCGTGELTRLAHERLGARATLGVDRSGAMLEKARAEAAPGLTFRQGDLAEPASWGAPGPFDVLVSNAALHWVPDHEALLARLAARLAPGGQLAIQVPWNEHHASHAVARVVARAPEHAAALGGFVQESPVLAPEDYARVLHRLGFEEQRVRAEVYAHVLPSPEAVVDWVRGTLLTAYQERLPPDAFARFVADYRARLLAALPDERPFLFTFRRILMWARLRPERGVGGASAG